MIKTLHDKGYGYRRIAHKLNKWNVKTTRGNTWFNTSVRWYEDGRKRLKANYKDNKEDGKDTEWYEDGRKKSEINWKDGEKDGKWTEWDENGMKRSESNYKDGVLID